MTGPGKARRGDHRPVSFRSAGAVAEHEHRSRARPRAAATLTISASAVGRYPPSDDLCPAEGSTVSGKSVRPQLNANTRCLASGACLETRCSRRHVIDNQPGKYDNHRKV